MRFGGWRWCRRKRVSSASPPAPRRPPSPSPYLSRSPHSVAAMPRSAGGVAVSEDAQVTKLASGLTFASVERGGATSSVGVYVKAGSRYEAAPGASHLLEHVAFHSTHQRSTLKIQRDFEELGATVGARTSALAGRRGAAALPPSSRGSPSLADRFTVLFRSPLFTLAAQAERPLRTRAACCATRWTGLWPRWPRSSRGRRYTTGR